MAKPRFHGNQYVYASGRRRPHRPAFTGNQYVDRNGKPRRAARSRTYEGEGGPEYEAPSVGGEAITYDDIDWDWDGLYDALDADLDDTDDESYSGE